MAAAPTAMDAVAVLPGPDSTALTGPVVLFFVPLVVAVTLTTKVQEAPLTTTNKRLQLGNLLVDDYPEFGRCECVGHLAFEPRIHEIGRVRTCQHFQVVTVKSSQELSDVVSLGLGDCRFFFAMLFLPLCAFLLLTLQVYLLGLLIGAGLHLPGWSAGTAVVALGRLLATGVMAGALMLPLGLAASAGRGYLIGVAALATIVFFAQVVAVLGYGRWFPWSVPAIYSGTAGPDEPPVGPPGFLLVALVGLAAIGATVLWWQRADQHR